MESMSNDFIVALNLISLVFSAFLALYAYRIKNNTIAFSFFLLMCIFTIWGGFKIVALYNHNPVAGQIISHFIRAITTFTPGLILFIVMQYTKYPSWFKPAHTKKFFIIPSLLALLSLLISIHYFLNEYFGIHLFHIEDYERPGILIIYLIYLYVCLVLSMFILIRSLFKSPYFFNRQLIFIIIAITLPAFNDFLFRINISIIPGYHLTPEMFIVGNLFFAWALFGYRFLKLAPVTNDLVINSIDDVIITISRDNLIMDLNSSCKQKFKLKSKKIIGESFYKVFSFCPNLITFFENSANSELYIEIENLEHCFSAKKSIVEYPKGDVIATVLLLRDITENKNAERKILAYSEELEHINATKNKFFSIIAHDLRNPFNAINSLSDIMVNNFDKLKKEEILQMLESIKKSSEKGYNLLQNLLDWARMQTNSIVFEPMLIRVHGIINHAIEIEKLQALKKNISITATVDKNLTVFADMNMISTVLRNLISNAIKFTYHNGSITISADKIADNKVEIVVTDNGVGIKSENLSKIFRIDSKFTTPGTDMETGSALGLILCKDFIEKNSGELKVESNINVGTSFYFTLPERTDV